MITRWTGTMLAVCFLGWSAAVLAQPPAPGSAGVPTAMPNVYPPPVNFIPMPDPVVDNAPSPAQDPTAGSSPSMSLGFEYLMYWVSTQKPTPLVTRGPSTDPIPAALGQPHTQVLLSKFDNDHIQYGGRLTAGFGLDDGGDFSVQASGFWLSDTGSRNRFSSAGEAGSPVLARPFFNVVAGVQDADPVAFPKLSSGTLQVDTNHRFYGADLALRYLYLGNPEARVNFLFGPTYFALEESLKFQENSQDLPGLGAPGNSYLLREAFSTHNSFYGGQFGVDYVYRLGPVFVQSMAKLGVGAVYQSAQRAPFIQITEPNGIVTSSNDRALYISPANAGKSSRSVFALMPEGLLRMGIEFNQHVQLSAGYSILYLNHVARPIDQADRNVIVQPVGTTATFVSRGFPGTATSTDFTAQGLNVMLRLSF